jgi:hypothetical protein
LLNKIYLILVLVVIGQDVLGDLFDEYPEGSLLPPGEAFEAGSPDEVEESVEVDEFFAASIDVRHDHVLDVWGDRLPQGVIFDDFF